MVNVTSLWGVGSFEPGHQPPLPPPLPPPPPPPLHMPMQQHPFSELVGIVYLKDLYIFIRVAHVCMHACLIMNMYLIQCPASCCHVYLQGICAESLEHAGSQLNILIFNDLRVGVPTIEKCTTNQAQAS